MLPERASPGGQRSNQYRVAFVTATRYRDLQASDALEVDDYWRVMAGWS